MKRVKDFRTFYQNAPFNNDVVAKLKKYSSLELKDKQILIPKVKEYTKKLHDVINVAVASNHQSLLARDLNQIKEFIHLVKTTLEKDDEVKNDLKGLNVDNILNIPNQPIYRFVKK